LRFAVGRSAGAGLWFARFRHDDRCVRRSCELTAQTHANKPFTYRLFKSNVPETIYPAPSLDTCEVFTMNRDTIGGQWKQLSGEIKKQWGKLTDNDLKVIQGDAKMLAGRLQERYGLVRDEAVRQVRDFERELNLSRHDTDPKSH
jgi:uncharacterized protein YjbJ (UPF0337 family)